MANHGVANGENNGRHIESGMAKIMKIMISVEIWRKRRKNGEISNIESGEIIENGE
jgi:hypothetical protein